MSESVKRFRLSESVSNVQEQPAQQLSINIIQLSGEDVGKFLEWSTWKVED